MTKKIVFTCEYCGLEFDNESDCEEHEETHIEDYSELSNKDIAKELDRLSLIAYDYRIGYSVMGMPITNFEHLMDEAAKRVREVEDDHTD